MEAIKTTVILNFKEIPSTIYRYVRIHNKSEKHTKNTHLFEMAIFGIDNCLESLSNIMYSWAISCYFFFKYRFKLSRLRWICPQDLASSIDDSEKTIGFKSGEHGDYICLAQKVHETAGSMVWYTVLLF